LNKNSDVMSWSACHALAILSVDDIKISSAGLDVFRRYDQGKISYDEAKDEILGKAKRKADRDGG